VPSRLPGALLVALLAAAAGCGNPTTGPTPSPIPTAGATPTAAPRPAATLTATLVPATVVAPPGAAAAVTAARSALAARLGVSEVQIALVGADAVDWPDTSLGCPQPGMAYAQIITPGFRITLMAAGNTFRYDADSGGRVIACP
jgi:hypothetical protein